MTKRCLSIILLGLLTALQALAVPYCDVRKFSILDGLAANNITDIQQTPDNLMWFATWNGISFYDGYSFHTFRETPGTEDLLTTNRFMKIRTCPDNNVWAVTEDRNLYLYNTHTCQFERTGQQINELFHINLKVQEVYSLKNGNNWIVSTDGKFLVRIKGETVDEKTTELIRVDEKSKYSGTIWFIRQDNHGREYILTDKGTIIYGTNFKTRIPFKWLRWVGQDIFLATTDGKLAIYNEQGHLSMIPMPEGVTRINELKNTGYQLLIATNIGIVIYNPRTFKSEVINVQSPSQPCAEVRKMYTDYQNLIWAFTDGQGVTLVNPKNGSKQWLFADSDTPLNRTQSERYFITQDAHNNLWIVPNQGTFSYYDRKAGRLVPYHLKSNSSGNYRIPKISNFFLSDQGILWVIGIHDLTQVNFKEHLYTLNLLDEGESEVRSLATTHTGYHWTGFANGLIKVTDSKGDKVGYLTPTGQFSPLQQPFSHDGIYMLTQDSKGRMWIGTRGDGLYLWHNGQVTHFTFDPLNPASVPANDIYEVTADSKGRLWVATWGGGLALIRETADGTVSFLSRRNGLPWPEGSHDKVRRIACTSGGEMLVASNNGLVTFKDDFRDPKKIHFYMTRHIENDSTSLTADDVNYIFIKSNGTVYLSTLGGALQTVTVKDVLRDNLPCRLEGHINLEEGVVQSLIEDNSGTLWVVREASIDRFNTKTGHVDVFGPNDFDYNMTFTEARPIHDPATDNIIVGTPMGGLTFNPRVLQRPDYQAKLVFTTLQIVSNNQTTSTPILHRDRLEIPANQRNLSISFASLDYTRKYQVKYQYRIDGMTPEGKWLDLGGRNTIYFNHIEHGDFVLKVRGTNSHGIWSKYTAELPITVNPTFWESIWGKLLLLFLCLAAIALIFRSYNRNQRRNMEHDMSVMKNDFFSDASHKLRTPLSLISGPVAEVLDHERNLSEEGRKLLEIVKRNAHEMLEMLDNILKVDNNTNFYVDGGLDNVAGTGTITDDNAAQVLSAVQKDDKALDDGTEEPPLITSTDKETTILVVEDNADLRKFLHTILQEKYNVLLAKNGKVGLQMARKFMPDFILTDVTMPVMNGIEMIHEIKQDTNISHIPIVILSAKASVEDHLKGYEEGIDAYLTKPFSATYLKGRIEAVIQQRHSLQQEMLKQIQEKENEEFITTRRTYEHVDRSQQPATAAEQPAQKSAAEEIQEMKDEGRSVMNLTFKDKTTEKIVKFITDNIDDPDLKIDDIAQAMGMSRSVLYGKIKNAVGMSPVDFVRHIRILRASELLKQTDDTLTSIAFSVGFSDPKYFSKVFKKEMGIIPSEYRERMKKM